MAADNSAEGLTSQLDEVWSSLAELGTGLTDTDWGLPTACPGWPVSAHYAHIIGTESTLLGRPSPEVDPGRPAHVRNDIGGFNEVWVAALAGVPRAEVMDRFTEVTGARRQVLAAMDEDNFSEPSWTPVGQADYRRFMQIRVFDCWVHEQDVRTAIDRPGHVTGPVAEQAVDEVGRALGYIVGKKAAAPAGSSVAFELTGPVSRSLYVVVDGRARLVDRLDAPPTVTVRLGSGAFTRLACGRVDPAAVLGEVRLSGDTELGERIVTSLPYTI
jgi:uncharacterized protein (TIGR03083 family)